MARKFNRIDVHHHLSPPGYIAELEKVFNCPLIESYGMTEASHQMASNPLPPAKRIPGSVGIAAGPEVAIMDNDGQLLPPGAIGEVVIRGENVTLGYENNPKANAEAYTHGWFRTGDQGVMDDEGYLTITGRLKEIINRGGEKVSPREVDEVLMDHPDPVPDRDPRHDHVGIFPQPQRAGEPRRDRSHTEHDQRLATANVGTIDEHVSIETTGT